jgi:hypothetical protein
MHSRFLGVLLAVGVLMVVVAGCHGGATDGTGLLVNNVGQSSSMTRLPPPMNVSGRRPARSPGDVHVPPMVKTPRLPPSFMKSRTPKKPDVSVEGPQFTALQGSGVQIVASAANPGSYCPGLESGYGSIYVISNGSSPDGLGDNYIWEGDGQGNWCNLPGLATQLAVSSSGVLYAVNASGYIYQWGGSSWTALAGTASAIGVGSDGSLYAVSNVNGSGDEPLWRYQGGTWTYVPGAGIAIVGNLDTNTYTTPGGTVGAGGFYIVTAEGYIYWGAADGSSYTGLPGVASAIAEVPIQNGSVSGGGLYALAYPASAAGTQLYYYDLDNPGWTGEPGSGTGIAAVTNETQATWVSTLYVIGGSDVIYSSPITAVPGQGGSPHPVAIGDTFRFTGQTTQTVTYSYPTSSPEPATNQSASVTQNITVTGTPCPSATGNITFSCSGQADFHVAEVDAYPDQSLYPTSDAWYALNGSNQWVLFGSNTTDGAGDTFTTSYGASPYILDELPETQGASWSNPGALNYLELDSDNSVTEQQINSNGTYSLTQTTDGGYGLGITTSATGPSTYAGGCIEAVTGICTGAFSPLGAIPNTCKSTTTPSLCGSYYEAWNSDYYGIVVQAPSSGTITVDVQKTPSATTTPTPTAIATPHAWYTPMPGNLLYSESDSIPQTSATIPTACNVPATFGTTGNEIQQQIEAIDPIVGYVSNESIKTWIVPGFGPVCIQMSNVENQYYNWTGDTERPTGTGAGWGTYVFSPLGANSGNAPVSVETITETLTLQSASGSDVNQDNFRHRAERITTTTRAAASSSHSASSTHALTEVEVGYARSRFETMVRHERVQRLRRFEKTMEHLLKRGGRHA